MVTTTDVSMRFEDLKDELEKVDHVSFDVFDTLLLRPFVHPEDLFDHLGNLNGIKDFKRIRVKAEDECRRAHPGEITLDEIYSRLGDDFSSMRDKEVSMEYDLALVNPEVMEIFNRVMECGKKVIFISDMYLPSKNIDEMLKKNGYKDYLLYVSSEYGFRKHDGSLYKKVLQDLGIDAGSLLHIGDNIHSDLRSPVKLGIRAIRYVPLRERYFAEFPKQRRFFQRDRSLGASVLLGLDMLQWLYRRFDDMDYWYRIGYRFGGPVSSFFIGSMMSVMPEDIDRIFFVSRDGYNLERVYGILSERPIENRYVHASRFFSVIFGQIMGDRSYAKMIFEHFSDELSVAMLEPGDGASNDTYIRLLDENKGLFDALLKREKERYGKYIREMAGESKKILVVDVTTMKYSSQRLIEGALGDEITVIGYYFNIMARGEVEYGQYNDCSNSIMNWTYVNVVEFFLGSPEYPIRDISDDGSPIYMEEVSDDERYRASIYGDITAAEEDYAHMLNGIFGKDIPEVSSDTIRGWLRILVSDSRSSGDELSKMQWTPDADHSISCDLMFRSRDAIYLFRTKLGQILWKISGKA